MYVIPYLCTMVYRSNRQPIIPDEPTYVRCFASWPAPQPNNRVGPRKKMMPPPAMICVFSRFHCETNFLQ